MRQNASIILPLVSFAIGLGVIIQSFVTGNFSQIGFAAILVAGSSYVFKRNLGYADTDLANKIKRELGDS